MSIRPIREIPTARESPNSFRISIGRVLAHYGVGRLLAQDGVLALELESISQPWASDFPWLGTGKSDPTSPYLFFFFSAFTFFFSFGLS